MFLIKNATIYDGTDGEGYAADILIEDGVIARIHKGIHAPDARVIDARGLAASPGFIDIHAHSDYAIPADPSAAGKIMQGVTTEVSGNCGLSAAPLLGAAARQREKDLEELGLTQTWTDFKGYFDMLESRNPAVNCASFCGHGSLRASVMGYDDREPSETEMRKMEDLLADAMTAGALGLATGLVYPPGVYCKTDELVRLGRVAGRFGGVYASHMRSEGAGVLAAIDEALKIGRLGGLPVEISHIKTSSPANWHLVTDMIEKVEAARAEGLAVTADKYPYTAGSTDLDAILPAWAYEGGNIEELKRLTDPAIRAKLRSECLSLYKEDYWGRAMISSITTEKNRALEGKRLSEAAQMRGQEPVDALFDILIEEELRVGGIFFSQSEENLRTFLKQEWVMVGSDSTARDMSGITRQGKPHPRTFGTFPKILGTFVRDEHLLTLPQAVRKMSSMAAEKLGLDGRGYLKEGFFADIVLFNPETVADRATYEEPYQFPVGIKYVFVNGALAVEDGKQTAARAGRVLRPGK
jgi:N-acyl-D-amino-acid deacylase